MTGGRRQDVRRATRRYDSPVRRQRAAETQERIITAGSELLHGFPIWNWEALTAAGVAQRAGVSERTVYRYFPNERALRDAILERLEQEAGVTLDGLRLGDVQDITARILAYTSSFPLASRTPVDETVAAANRRQRDALVRAVGEHAQRWSGRDQEIAAAVLDVLWSVVSYERMVTQWDLDPTDAILGITWAIGLVEDAVRGGAPPGRRHGGRR